MQTAAASLCAVWANHSRGRHWTNDARRASDNIRTNVQRARYEWICWLPMGCFRVFYEMEYVCRILCMLRMLHMWSVFEWRNLIIRPSTGSLGTSFWECWWVAVRLENSSSEFHFIKFSAYLADFFQWASQQITNMNALCLILICCFIAELINGHWYRNNQCFGFEKRPVWD